MARAHLLRWSVILELLVFVNIVLPIPFYQQSNLKQHYAAVTSMPMESCSNAQGICLVSHACPWNRVISDIQDLCALVHDGLVCCHVSRVRLPVDMFHNYH